MTAQQITEIDRRIHMIGAPRQRLSISALGLDRGSGGFERNAEIEHGIDISGACDQRVAEGGDGLGVTPGLTQRHAKVVVRLGKARSHFYTFAQMLHRQRRISGLQRHDAKQMPGVGIGGIEFGRALIMALRKTELAGAMQHCAFVQLFQRQALVVGAHASNVRQ